jgi:DNA-binding CsgD family transcriptional regulator
MFNTLFFMGLMSVCATMSTDDLNDRGRSLALHALNTLPDPDQRYRTMLDQICDEFGLDYAAYVGGWGYDARLVGIVTYPEAWIVHYASQGFHKLDLAFLAASRAVGVVDWSQLRRLAGFERVFREAADFGIGAFGLTLPLRGLFGDRGIFSVVFKATDAQGDLLRNDALSALQQRAALFHDTITRATDRLSVVQNPCLSAREREILQWIAAGKSQSDIATILAISTRTVEVHLRSTRHKLGALTTPQAVARAIGFGIIHPK